MYEQPGATWLDSTAGKVDSVYIVLKNKEQVQPQYDLFLIL